MVSLLAVSVGAVWKFIKRFPDAQSSEGLGS